MDIEQWKPVNLFHFKDYYEVSNYGNVRNRKTKKIKSIIYCGKYSTVHLSYGQDKCYRVHRLVALTFLENSENKIQVNHIDGNPKNNHVDNLEWVTSNENIQHAWNNGIYKKERADHKTIYDDKCPYIDEIWKPIKQAGFYKRYKISNYGRIKNNKTNKILKPFLENGYYRVKLYYKNLRSKTFRVHRLLYEVFIGQIGKALVINHLDGDRANNKLSNLVMCTQKENTRHAYDILHPYNSSTFDVKEIENLYNNGTKTDDIAKIFNTSATTVRRCLLKYGIRSPKINISREYLYEKYITENMKRIDICNMLNISYNSLSDLLHKYKITKRRMN